MTDTEDTPTPDSKPTTEPIPTPKRQPPEWLHSFALCPFGGCEFCKEGVSER